MSEKKTKEKKPKVQLSEMELAEKQADRMLRDMGRLQKTQKQSADKKDERSNVDLWKDTDFYFSVVFQSAAQKYEFLEQFSKMFNLGIDNIKTSDETFSIVNGLTLAKNLQIKIPVEKIGEYPYPNLELQPLALDSEAF